MITFFIESLLFCLSAGLAYIFYSMLMPFFDYFWNKYERWAYGKTRRWESDDSKKELALRSEQAK